MADLFPLIGMGIFLLMILVGKASFLIARRKPETFFETASKTVEAAIFGLLGLLIALTFAGAHSRFEARRTIIANESNAIQTAFLRLDLLPKDAQLQLQTIFIDYIQSRINFYPKMISREEALNELEQTEKMQEKIWNLAISESAHIEETTVRMLILPALNQMFDIVTSRTVAVQSHTSLWIFLMLVLVAMVCAFLSAVQMAKKGHYNWVYIILFAAVTSITIYMIYDLEYPRYGLIRLDFTQEILEDAKANMIAHMDGN